MGREASEYISGDFIDVRFYIYLITYSWRSNARATDNFTNSLQIADAEWLISTLKKKKNEIHMKY